MPATSSRSFVKQWPRPETVIADLRKWAGNQAARRPELIALGYFGSHARGETGFGSDLDLVAILSESDVPQMERNRDWPFELLPVPTDLLIYTAGEWRRMMRRGGRFAEVMEREVVWVLGEGRQNEERLNPAARPDEARTRGAASGSRP